MAAVALARREVARIAVGCREPWAAKIAMAVAGTSWMELVLIARNVHIAFDAMPGWGFRVSRLRMAFSPRGVAALPRPSILAAMLSTIAPRAGCPSGTSGNSIRVKGWSLRASASTRPERSARRNSPSHSPIIPAKGSATAVIASFAAEKAPLVTASRRPVKPPKKIDVRIKPSQRPLSMGVVKTDWLQGKGKQGLRGRKKTVFEYSIKEYVCNALV